MSAGEFDEDQGFEALVYAVLEGCQPVDKESLIEMAVACELGHVVPEDLASAGAKLWFDSWARARRANGRGHEAYLRAFEAEPVEDRVAIALYLGSLRAATSSVNRPFPEAG